MPEATGRCAATNSRSRSTTRAVPSNVPACAARLARNPSNSRSNASKIRPARLRVGRERPVAERAHVPRVDELLEQARDGKTQHRFAEVQRLADEVVPAVDHGVRAGGEIVQDPVVVERFEEEVAAPVLALRAVAVDDHRAVCSWLNGSSSGRNVALVW